MGQPPFEKRFWIRVEKMGNGCWEWQGKTSTSGYGQIKYDGKNMHSHRASWIFHNGIIQNGLSVLHKCDNKLCVNPHHLYLGTQQDNIRDRQARDRFARGERQGNAKLTTGDVKTIRWLAKSGFKHVWLAKIFKVTLQNINAIVHRKSWYHLKEDDCFATM